MSEKVHWILHKQILERNVNKNMSLDKSIIKYGHKLSIIDYNFNTDFPESILELDSNNCILSWGSISFIKKIQNTIKKANCYKIPIAYCNFENLKYSTYSAYIGKHLINEDFQILPFGEFIRRNIQNDVFIRPDKGNKSFTGLTIKKENFEHEINCLKKIQKIEPETLIIITKPKQIIKEFRFIIANREVLTGSEYSWEENFIYTNEIDENCLNIAKEIAKNKWQPDIVYTCDVGIYIENNIKKYGVVELNSFSCAGLYNANTDIIVNKISEIALKDHNNELNEENINFLHFK